MSRTNCRVCGKEIECDGFVNPVMCDECNRTWLELSKQSNSVIGIKTLNVPVTLAASCIICGESVPLTMEEEMGSRNGYYIFKVCDVCKEAVMKMRELTHQHEDKGE